MRNPGACEQETAEFKEEEEEECYVYDSEVFLTLGSFFDTFPTLSLDIEGIMLNWYPRQYLVPSVIDPNVFCGGPQQRESWEYPR